MLTANNPTQIQASTMKVASATPRAAAEVFHEIVGPATHRLRPGGRRLVRDWCRNACCEDIRLLEFTFLNLGDAAIDKLCLAYSRSDVSWIAKLRKVSFISIVPTSF